MNLQDAYFEQRFENAFMRAKGDAFQDFFAKLMGLAYKTDFMACRPWGKQGDRKNDGYKERIDGFDVRDHVLPVVLTDAREDGGLFGFRF